MDRHRLARIRSRARPIARWGTVSLGTVYLLVGVLALLALFGVLTGHADEDRLIHVVMDLPGGSLLIWTVILGLAGYAFWRFTEVIVDPYELGSDAAGIAKRVGVGLTGVGYGLLAVSAAKIALRHEVGPASASEQEQQQLVARVLDWPGGAWWVGAVAMLLFGFAVVQLWLIAKQSYTMEIAMEERSRVTRGLLHALAWAGYAARGVILGVLGYFLLRAALDRDPSEAGDTDTAFDFIGGGLAGDTAFFFVAVGTVGYGVFLYLAAAFYKFHRDDAPA
jgi:hypothetical protein